MEIGQGQFVLVKTAPQRRGKSVRVRGERIEVEWFYAVTMRRREWFPKADVVVAAPLRQTRCYFFAEAENYWRAGRLMGVEAGIAYIAFPEGEQAQMPEAKTFVRCHTGRPDPLELTREGIYDTPFFHTGRVPLAQSLAVLQAATHGMTALLSSRIRLFDHQINVVRRVLEDPIQRYLLADEVGLGKTIEAGAILRQLALDEPGAKILLLAPPVLTGQWKTEIQDKFACPLLPARIDILPHSALHPSNAPLSCCAYDLVIVDEAHHVARYAYGGEGGADAWERLTLLCRESPRLLLLSATPALHHEADFLAMLHLLEPQSYDLGDVDAFRARIRNREDVASALDMIQEDLRRPRELTEAADALREYLPGDDWLQEQAKELDAAATRIRGGAPENMTPVLRRIRLHICETHRIHRRMLRSSRRRLPPGLLPERKNAPLTLEQFTDPRFARTDYNLNVWREAALLAGADDDSYQRLFRLFLGLSTVWPPLLRDALARRHGAVNSPCLDDGLRRLLMEPPPVHGEAAVLDAWRRDLEDDSTEQDAIADLMDVLQHHKFGRRVVFTAFTAVGEEIARRLETIMHSRYLYAHLATIPSEERYRRLQQFAAETESAVLICDHTGEEGLNLQFADRVFHFDLPWDVNRLEQRIGRLDRIGRDKPAPPQHFFLPDEPENSFADTFLSLLRDGVGLFKESVADLQFLLDREIADWVREAFYQGADALRGHAPRIRATIEQERILLRKQSALDEIEAYENDDADFAQTLRREDSDENQERFRRSLRGWMVGALRFGATREDNRFRHEWETLLPQDRWEPIARAVPPAARLTFSRDAALTDAKAELLRPGHPYIDRLTEYLDWEDRGLAWAMWRILGEESPITGDRAFFRFDVLATADDLPLRVARPTLTDNDLRPLRRRLTGWLPPEFLTVFVDARNDRPVTKASLLGVLNHPYDKRENAVNFKDISLMRPARRAVLTEILPDYRERLDCGADAARTFALTDPERAGRWERGAARIRKTLEIRLDQLRRGLIFRGQGGDVEEERTIYDALIEGVRRPALQFDAIGLIVLSNRNPFTTGDTE